LMIEMVVEWNLSTWFDGEKPKHIFRKAVTVISGFRKPPHACAKNLIHFAPIGKLLCLLFITILPMNNLD
jgi:hypothetical protein